MGDIQVRAYADNFAFIDIVIYREMSDHFLVYCPKIIGDRIKWDWVEFHEGELMTPSFKVPRMMERNGVLNLIIKELMEQFGAVPAGHEDSKSVLQAKQDHLDDLRNVLFNSDWIEVQRGEPAALENKDADI